VVLTTGQLAPLPISPEGTTYKLIRALQGCRKNSSAPSGLENGQDIVPVVQTTGYTIFPFQGNK
jgi:hypothetical protein